MSHLWTGLQVAVVGMAVVFVGLVILIGCINILAKLSGKKKEEAEKLPAPTPAYEPELLEELGQDEELIAVITAALAAMLGQEQAQLETPEEPVTGLRVRSIRRISNAPVWNRAGRSEQIDSHH